MLSVPLILAYPGIATLHGWVLWVILNLASIVKTFFSVCCCTPLSCFERATQFATIHFYSQFYSFFGKHMWIITLHIDINSVINGHCLWSCLKQLELFWPAVCIVECRWWFSMPHLYYWTIPWYDLSPTHTSEEHFCVVHQGKYRQHYYIVDSPTACMFDSHRKKGE